MDQKNVLSREVYRLRSYEEVIEFALVDILPNWIPSSASPNSSYCKLYD
jgi:hypothetical protein